MCRFVPETELVELQGDGLPEGVRRLLRLGVMSEWQRDWAREATVEAVAEISLAHGGSTGTSLAWELQLLWRTEALAHG